MTFRRHERSGVEAEVSTGSRFFPLSSREVSTAAAIIFSAMRE
ncbi:hypothetical protein RISK_000143 [Rhodopirellula islandica]|uniref:Uncharacterized protein n=1 Tax=Rhodopirellula islandica TaxID=595434 RepID=A0A0J1ER73_RHOIS|nr:hypothetical protein RISK_000143 [Rhodopirellula islandica]